MTTEYLPPEPGHTITFPESMRQIAAYLAGLYKQEAEVSIRADDAKINAAALLTQITPLEGWPGKNEQAREIAEGKALAENTHYQVALAAVKKERDALIFIQAEIKATELTLSVEKWAIRHALARALGGYAEKAGGQRDEFDAAVDESTYDPTNDI
jgi:hypothetical protein